MNKRIFEISEAETIATSFPHRTYLSSPIGWSMGKGKTPPEDHFKISKVYQEDLNHQSDFWWMIQELKPQWIAVELDLNSPLELIVSQAQQLKSRVKHHIVLLWKYSVRTKSLIEELSYRADLPVYAEISNDCYFDSAMSEVHYIEGPERELHLSKTVFEESNLGPVLFARNDLDILKAIFKKSLSLSGGNFEFPRKMNSSDLSFEERLMYWPKFLKMSGDLKSAQVADLEYEIYKTLTKFRQFAVTQLKFKEDSVFTGFSPIRIFENSSKEMKDVLKEYDICVQDSSFCLVHQEEGIKSVEIGSDELLMIEAIEEGVSQKKHVSSLLKGKNVDKIISKLVDIGLLGVKKPDQNGRAKRKWQDQTNNQFIKV